MLPDDLGEIYDFDESVTSKTNLGYMVLKKDQDKLPEVMASEGQRAEADQVPGLAKKKGPRGPPREHGCTTIQLLRVMLLE